MSCKWIPSCLSLSSPSYSSPVSVAFSAKYDWGKIFAQTDRLQTYQRKGRYASITSKEVIFTQ